MLPGRHIHVRPVASDRHQATAIDSSDHAEQVTGRHTYKLISRQISCSCQIRHIIQLIHILSAEDVYVWPVSLFGYRARAISREIKRRLDAVEMWFRG